MRGLISGLAVAFALAAPSAVFGDSLFTLNGTLADGTGVFDGTLDLRQNGTTYVQGTLTDGSFSFTLPTSYLGQDTSTGNFTDVDVFAVGASFDLTLDFPDAVLASGGALCSVTNACSAGGFASSFYTGSFAEQKFETIASTPVSATPEPGSLVLLGTGLLGMLGLARRRVLL